ncbi:MAG: ATP-dependent DNA helicase [Gemmatimonadota bacterium]|nr:ATP-dependent DNA helicase [Gemmatimonadota bacterium]
MTATYTIDDARDVLRSSFGYPAFRPGQERAVESVLAGRDTLVILPTGGGKSLCFQVPALMLPGLTVVVSPLISLMKDQVDALTAKGLPAAFINSTLSANEVADRLSRAERGEIKLLYVAPERFDFGNSADRLRAMGVSLLAIDEAHCISEWGHDFRPSYLRIRAVRDRLGNPHTVALTATATPEVRADIVKQLGLTNAQTIITGFDRTNLHYHVVRTRGDTDKDAALVDVLRDREGLAIVYASTRKAVERVTGALERARIPAIAYHAGLDDAHRHDVQNAFMAGEVRVIVATNAFGMGIDKANVRLVIHHAMPGTLEAYYQEAGRAGRDGKHSDCVLLHAFPDRFTHEFFIKSAYPDRATVEKVYQELRRTADSTGCVRGTAADIAASMKADVKDREVESALRILTGAGALANELASNSRLFVRLLALPERIKREIDDPVERELLRAMWRVVGPKMYEGAAINSDGLPPGFGNAQAVAATLESLQQRQILTWERTGGGLRLVSAGRPLDALGIDWPTLDRRRRADLSKLDAMQKYAYTSACRRGFVLRYFGDPAAREKCDGCDNCLGTHIEPDKHAPKSKTRKAKVPRDERARRAESAASAASDAFELGPGDATLLAALKQLRGALARDDHVPAYVVFPDRTLHELAVRRPLNLAAMQTVRGVGPAKLDKYGERFLAVIRGANDTEAA